MSNTTKDEKPSMLDDLKKQAEEIAAKIKAATAEKLSALHLRLEALHKEVQSVTEEIRSHGGTEPKRRGRKPGSTVKLNGFPPKKGKGRSKGVKSSIVAFLQKNKNGATIGEVQTALPNVKYGSISQALNQLVKGKEATKKKGRSTPYVLTK